MRVPDKVRNRALSRGLRFLAQLQSDFVGQMVSFQAIDLLIRQNTMLPRRCPTAGPGNNVIDIAFVRPKLFPGVLAFPSVSFPNPSGRKLWPAFRHLIVTG